MKLRRGSRSAAADVDRALTPLIDVVFLLLIFFVCAGSGGPAEEVLGLALSSPEAEAEASEPAGVAAPAEVDFGELVIELRRNGGVTVAVANDAEVDGLEAIEALLDELADAGGAAEVPVTLDVDGNVPVGDAVRVFDAAVAAGFATVNFAAGGDVGSEN